jgi:hypothetical protein
VGACFLFAPSFAFVSKIFQLSVPPAVVFFAVLQQPFSEIVFYRASNDELLMTPARVKRTGRMVLHRASCPSSKDGNTRLEFFDPAARPRRRW